MSNLPTLLLLAALGASACKRKVPVEYRGIPLSDRREVECAEVGSDIRSCVAGGKLYTCIGGRGADSVSCALASAAPTAERP